jgi:hypothetical protein
MRASQFRIPQKEFYERATKLSKGHSENRYCFAACSQAKMPDDSKTSISKTGYWPMPITTVIRNAPSEKSGGA